jgi:hypothetical protein
VGQRFDQPGEIRTVLGVLYVIFTEGHTGEIDLAREAIRLTGQLAAVTDDPEVDWVRKAPQAGPRGPVFDHWVRKAPQAGPRGPFLTIGSEKRLRPGRGGPFCSSPPMVNTASWLADPRRPSDPMVKTAPWLPI